MEMTNIVSVIISKCSLSKVSGAKGAVNTGGFKTGGTMIKLCYNILQIV